MPSLSWFIEQTLSNKVNAADLGCTVNGLEKATVPQNCGEINIYSTDPVNSLLFCSIKWTVLRTYTQITLVERDVNFLKDL